MSRRHLGVALLAAAIMLLLAPARPASATYTYLYDNWTSAQKVTDPSDDTEYPGRDIVAAYKAYDKGYLYFRVDLLNAPSANFPPGYANTYGIYIDSRDGGAPNSNEYVPGRLTGIDFIVSSQADLEKHDRLNWDKKDLVWKPDADEFKTSADLVFQHVMNDGKTLEWKVKDGPEQGDRYIGNSFTWWAATMLPSDDAQIKTTYNVTATPIPGAGWLLGSGLLGLVGLKRRSSREA